MNTMTRVGKSWRHVASSSHPYAATTYFHLGITWSNKHEAVAECAMVAWEPPLTIHVPLYLSLVQFNAVIIAAGFLYVGRHNIHIDVQMRFR